MWLWFANFDHWSRAEKLLLVVFLLGGRLFASQAPYTGKIEHIVIILQENRSFDNYFGHFSGVTGYPVNTVGSNVLRCSDTFSSCTQRGFSSPPCAGGTDVCGFTLNLRHAVPTTKYADCPHSRADSLAAIDASSSRGVGRMDGFTPLECGMSGAPCTLLGSTAAPCGPDSQNFCRRNCVQYYDATDIPFYYSMAQQFGLADNAFTSVSGPSYPNHLMFIAAQPYDVMENPNVKSAVGSSNAWGCFSMTAAGNECSLGRYPCGFQTDNPPITAGVSLSGSAGNSYNAGICGGITSSNTYCLNSDSLGGTCAGVDPTCSARTGITCNVQRVTCRISAGMESSCAAAAGNGGTSLHCQTTRCLAGSLGCICPQITTIGDELDRANISWKWYGAVKGTPGAVWTAPYYTPSGAFGSDFNKVVSPFPNYFDDIANGTLPQVSWISPGLDATRTLSVSEHPPGTVHDGEVYVQSLMQAIFRNPALYATTMVCLTWDDFGGFADHVPPPVVDNQGLGIRAPLLCTGPYVRNAVVHARFDIANSLLRCIEDVFGLAAMTARDARATSVCKVDGTAMVNLNQMPIPAPAVVVAAAPGAKRTEDPSPNADLVTLVRRVFHRKHTPVREEIPTLASRTCHMGTTLHEHVLYRPTGQYVDICGSDDGSLLLRPGQELGDMGDADETQTRDE
jgi:phospholipase C